MKLKRVLAGLKSQMDIKEIHVLSDEKVIFSGSIEQWTATSVDMILYKREVENTEVKKCMTYRGKVFLFI